MTTTAGAKVTVDLTATTTVTRTGRATAGALHAGDTVTVVGRKSSGGTGSGGTGSGSTAATSITATSVTATAKGIRATTGGVLPTGGPTTRAAASSS